MPLWIAFIWIGKTKSFQSQEKFINLICFIDEFTRINWFQCLYQPLWDITFPQQCRYFLVVLLSTTHSHVSTLLLSLQFLWICLRCLVGIVILAVYIKFQVFHILQLSHGSSLSTQKRQPKFLSVHPKSLHSWLCRVQRVYLLPIIPSSLVFVHHFSEILVML